MKRFIFALLPLLILSALAYFICDWFEIYFTSEWIASVDLPSHIRAMEQLRTQLLSGRVSFYDPFTFTGWPVGQFYGFLPALLTVIVSYFLDTFSGEPVRLAAQSMLAVGSALLPFSMYYAALPFARDVLTAGLKEEPGKARLESWRWLVAISVATFTFWFLNHDDQWFGIGAAAPMNIGLYAQLFAWHFLLIYLGALTRLIQRTSRGAGVLAALALSLLVVTHTLTFVFALYLGIMSCFWFAGRRGAIALAHIVGLFLPGFWLVPFLAYMGGYTTYDIHRPEGDFLQFLLRYPLFGLVRSVPGWIQGHFTPLDSTYLLILLLLLVALGHTGLRRTKLIFPFLGFVLLGVVIFSSNFIAASLPLGLHYYRFLGYLFLILLVPLSTLGLVLIRPNPPGGHPSAIRSGIWALLFVPIFVNSIKLPHYERDMITQHVGEWYLRDENNVLNYFKNLPEKGRVYFEYANDYSSFPPLSCHYLATKLHHQTGFESVVNSQLQRAPAYRMIAASAKLLGAKTYNVPLLIVDASDLDPATEIEQLKSFGITHIVAAHNEFFEQVKKFAISPPVTFGLYSIVEIQKPPYVRISPVTKNLLGYIDLKGNLPFHLLELYFYGHKELFQRYELISLPSATEIPEQIRTVLINAGRTGRTAEVALIHENTGRQVIRVNFDRPFQINHYKLSYPTNVELEHYREINTYLSDRIRIAALLRDVFGKEFRPAEYKDLPTPALTWDEKYQSFVTSGLLPHIPYRINYSYFPYWQTGSGQAFRGSSERIILIPDGNEAEFYYSKINSFPTWIGLAVTLLGLLLLLRLPANTG